MNTISKLAYRFRRWVYALRHTTYRLEIEVVQPTGGDDTANIQAAIDRAVSESPTDYQAAEATYAGYRVKWLHRKPVLDRITKFTPGQWSVNQPLKVPSNVTITGKPYSPEKVVTK